MSDSQSTSIIDLSPTHHALLFAWIAEALVTQIGLETAETALRQAVRRYGEQRGHRMALRAQAAGDPLTMATYLAYGEWQPPAGQAEQATQVVGSDVRAVVQRCPWYDAWEAEGLLRAGRLYCLEIDQALARGFAPALTLEVNAIRPIDNASCEFVFRDGGQRPPNLASRRKVMPWDYHLGHLFHAIRRSLTAQLGAAGADAAAAGLAEFSRWYGPEAAVLVQSFQETDFDMPAP
jgi:hypothetical protein